MEEIQDLRRYLTLWRPVVHRNQNLKQNPVMMQIQLAECLNLTRKQVQKVIKVLQEEGSLEREGSNRNGHWVVRGQ